MPESEMTWGDWLREHHGSTDLMQISSEQADQRWDPTEEDRKAAWILFTELRTRIATQPLHYRSGDEETALESLHKLFGMIRRIVEQKGPDCRHFATIAIHVLNTHIRPLTAKWHKKLIDGRLRHDDDRCEFRRELQAVQKRLLEFCRLLGGMAEGKEYLEIDVCSPVSTTSDTKRDRLGPDIPFDHILFESGVLGTDKLYEAESETIRQRRNVESPINNLAGLACSGGGIRSATFCLGVAQALHRHGLLPGIDYLSTVSGGGYFGAFLSSYLNDPDRQHVGLETDKLPFVETGRTESGPIRQLRNNSKYLLKGGLLGQSRMAGLLLFGILVNLLTLLPVLFGTLTLTHIATLLGATPEGFFTIVGVVLAALLGAILLMLLGLPLIYRLWALQQPRIARYEKSALGVALLCIGVWALGWLLPWVDRYLSGIEASPGIVLSLFGLLPFLFAWLASTLGMSTLAGRVLIVLAGIAGPLLLLLTFLVLNRAIDTSWSMIVSLVIVSAVLIAWLRLINVNQITPHRYYRNRLVETYLLRRGTTTAVEQQPLSQLQKHNVMAPYHLINAAVNLPSSRMPGLRGRDSDFFLFSRHFCGSPLLGYCTTQALETKDTNLDLGTAMAISGAAASSYMGTNTVRGLGFWLTLLNVRLGYWLPNPKRLDKMKGRIIPRPFSIWRELFGQIDEEGQFVNLSDGGHIENLAIYELLRRRCKFIIAIDAEADPEMGFPSLMKLIQYAQIDFGIDIRIDLGDLRRYIRGFSKAHFVLGEINYGYAQRGYLLYIKPSLTGNERDYILDYRQHHPTFPHETTADQFFSEAQFEAYRALGEHIGRELFRSELIGEERDLTMETWFAALSNNLLEERISATSTEDENVKAAHSGVDKQEDPFTNPEFTRPSA